MLDIEHIYICRRQRKPKHMTFVFCCNCTYYFCFPSLYFICISNPISLLRFVLFLGALGYPTATEAPSCFPFHMVPREQPQQNLMDQPYCLYGGPFIYYYLFLFPFLFHAFVFVIFILRFPDYLY